MRLKLQKRSEQKFVSRIILHKQGIMPRNLLRNLFPKLALVFIPVMVFQFHPLLYPDKRGKICASNHPIFL
ncbi:MAG: hypothetical protein A2W27_10685 [Deltaproteobacteria bacterium RBG_16_44_11]|nr:MAG: hypothetical protein A2W27_10685 [Deltaproteobacteria bacterium RBG_16_44_11]